MVWRTKCKCSKVHVAFFRNSNFLSLPNVDKNQQMFEKSRMLKWSGVALLKAFNQQYFVRLKFRHAEF